MILIIDETVIPFSKVGTTVLAHGGRKRVHAFTAWRWAKRGSKAADGSIDGLELQGPELGGRLAAVGVLDGADRIHGVGQLARLAPVFAGIIVLVRIEEPQYNLNQRAATGPAGLGGGPARQPFGDDLPVLEGTTVLHHQRSKGTTKNHPKSKQGTNLQRA
jgi:hypothetical protein